MEKILIVTTVVVSLLLGVTPATAGDALAQNVRVSNLTSQELDAEEVEAATGAELAELTATTAAIEEFENIILRIEDLERKRYDAENSGDNEGQMLFKHLLSIEQEKLSDQFRSLTPEGRAWAARLGIALARARRDTER